jgi:exodeoxyribonuclease VII large subunit
VVPDRVEVAAGLLNLEHRGRAVVLRCVAASRAEVAAEGRALDGLRPAAQLAQARERAGYLLDRATGAMQMALSRRRAGEGELAARLRPLADARLAQARNALDRNAASLAALGPQATLDRGYAIVRRRSDGRIVRSPQEAPIGEGLAVRVAHGELGATVDDSGGGVEEGR